MIHDCYGFKNGLAPPFTQKYALAILQAITAVLPPGNKVGPVRGVPRGGLAAMEAGLVELVGATLLATQAAAAGVGVGARSLLGGASNQSMEECTASSKDHPEEVGIGSRRQQQEGVSWGAASKWRAATAAVQQQQQQQQQRIAKDCVSTEMAGSAGSKPIASSAGSKPAPAAGSQGAKPTVSAAFISTLRTAASSGPKAQMADWYGLLLLLRQLLRSLRALADSTEGLLMALPPGVEVAAK
jgi:hypothetical protein